MTLQDREAYHYFPGFYDDPEQIPLDVLQYIINTKSPPVSHQVTLLVALLRLFTKLYLYPSCAILEGVKREPDACAGGGFSDVYKGTFRGQLVCVKMTRVFSKYPTSHAQAFKMFSREVGIWNQVRHPNVLPFLGIHLDGEYRRLCLVSPWMESGNIRRYLSMNPQACRLSLVRDIVHGLTHLHYKNIIHGDLKGPNVLVSPSGRACLADFGLAHTSFPDMFEWTPVRRPAHGGGNTLRWIAPELIMSDKYVASKESDIYALGVVWYEVFTGLIPFHEIDSDYRVVLAVVTGRRPSKPSGDSKPFTCWGLTEDIWSLIGQCWESDPRDRPTARGASQQLPRPCYTNHFRSI